MNNQYTKENEIRSKISSILYSSPSNTRLDYLEEDLYKIKIKILNGDIAPSASDVTPYQIVFSNLERLVLDSIGIEIKNIIQSAVFGVSYYLNNEN